METEEIDDVLMAQLLRAVAKYDPKYTEKVQVVVEALDEKLPQCGQFTLSDINRHVEFDCNRYLRLLCRHGYLTPATGKAKGYVRGGSWPPDEKFFRSRPPGERSLRGPAGPGTQNVRSRSRWPWREPVVFPAPVAAGRR